MIDLLAWSAQAAALAGAALMAPRLLRVEAPALTCALQRAALAGCVLLPLAQVLYPGLVPPPASGPVPGAITVWFGLAGTGPDGPLRGGALETWTPLIVALLAAGAALRLAWLAAGAVRLRALRRAAVPGPADGQFPRLQQAIGTAAAICRVEALAHPVTFGLRHPIVLVPAALDRHAEGIQEAVVAHELWHVRRRDWLWTVTEELVRAICWFHPVVWRLVTAIQASREELVDRLAVRTLGSKRTYMEALLTFADELPLSAAPAFARPAHLVRRMHLIAQEAVMSFRRLVFSAGVLGLILASVAWSGLQAFPMVSGTPRAEAAGRARAAGAQDGRRDLDEGAYRAGGDISTPRKIKDVQPVYPEDAKAAGVTGVVILEARVERDGTVSDAQVIRSVEMLDQSALDAVLQWEFEPGTLDGEPVPVVVTITIAYTLK